MKQRRSGTGTGKSKEETYVGLAGGKARRMECRCCDREIWMLQLNFRQFNKLSGGTLKSTRFYTTLMNLVRLDGF